MVSEVVLVGGEGMGSPDAKLGRLLLGNFLRLLGDRESVPEYVVLWNGGVKTATADAETLGSLKRIEERGVKVVLCRTCVEYFGVADEIAVGEIDGMARILEILSSHRVLTV